MPPRIKSPLEKEQLRDKVVDAARDLFVCKGFEAVTMRELAQRIGFSATAIYLYFSDKEALMRAVCDADLLKLAHALQSVMAISNPVERLLAIGEGYANFALTYPNQYRMLFMMPHPVHAPEHSTLQQNNIEQDAYYQLKTVVQEVLDSGGFIDDLKDPDLIAQTIWGATHGVCALEIIMAKDTWVSWRSIEDRLLAIRQLIIKGMLKNYEA
jgi:AcrR family transcriptional regulator